MGIQAGYDTYSGSASEQVYLNSHQIKHVTCVTGVFPTIFAGIGYVDTLVMDADNRMVIDGDKPKTHRYYGFIKLKWREVT